MCQLNDRKRICETSITRSLYQADSGVQRLIEDPPLDRTSGS